MPERERKWGLRKNTIEKSNYLIDFLLEIPPIFRKIKMENAKEMENWRYETV